MKLFAAAFITGSLMLGTANARVLTFDFTATITVANAHPGTGTPSTPGMPTDAAFTIGNTIRGQFSFDLLTPKWDDFFPVPQPSNSTVYRGNDATVRSSMSIVENGYSFSSGGFTSVPSLIVVGNGPAEEVGDYFSLETWSGGAAGSYQSMRVYFGDFSGAAFSSVAIPTEFPLSAFNSANVSYNWGRSDVGAHAQFIAEINSVTVSSTSPVPEPASYAMYVLGLLAVGAVARRRQGVGK